MEKKCIIVTGPTASGKTDLAFHIATILREKGKNAGIINADSMQLYHHLRILTARPSEQEKERFSYIPYLLDGILSDNDKASTGWWLNQAVEIIHSFFEEERYPIIVGGTGLYLKVLVEGLSLMPEIPEEIRDMSRNLIDVPLDILKSELVHIFPEVVKYKDPQRLLRAYEIFIATGKTIEHFQGAKKPPVDCDFITIALIPDRKELCNVIDRRFVAMMESGALEEIKNLLDQNLDSDHPILKATGVKAMSSYLDGMVSYEKALEMGKQHTRQYAKRQLTWIRNQSQPDLTFDSYNVSLDDMARHILARVL